MTVRTKKCFFTTEAQRHKEENIELLLIKNQGFATVFSCVGL